MSSPTVLSDDVLVSVDLPVRCDGSVVLVAVSVEDVIDGATDTEGGVDVVLAARVVSTLAWSSSPPPHATHNELTTIATSNRRMGRS